MTYHADFWVLAGTTSPVVALASIVSAWLTLAALSGDKRLSARLIQGVTYFIGLINIALQGVVAQAALTSLSADHDSEPMHATTDHVVTGLGLLFAGLVCRLLAEAVSTSGNVRKKKGAAITAEDAVPRIFRAHPPA
jgi:hypothetical protein